MRVSPAYRLVSVVAATLLLGACGGADKTRPTTTVVSVSSTSTSTTAQPTTTATTLPPKVAYEYSVKGKGELTTNIDEFAAVVATSFSDARGWTFGGQMRFQQVESEGDFTVWLATAATMTSFGSPCSKEYSCRNGRNVVINEERWNKGGFLTMELAEYRTMVINHETGHWLGLGHSTCPGPGRPANLMQQQSKGGSFLGACTPNAWPTQAELQQVANSRNLKL
jgi:hypothetical protein